MSKQIKREGNKVVFRFYVLALTCDSTMIELLIHLLKLQVSQMLRVMSTQVARITSILAELHASQLFRIQKLGLPFKILETFSNLEIFW